MKIVRTEYSKELRDNTALAALVPRISLSVDAMLSKYDKVPAVVQVWQLASKDADRSWVGFRDSKGKNKVILTILLEIMYSV